MLDVLRAFPHVEKIQDYGTYALKFAVCFGCADNVVPVLCRMRCLTRIHGRVDMYGGGCDLSLFDFRLDSSKLVVLQLQKRLCARFVVASICKSNVLRCVSWGDYAPWQLSS